MFKKKLELVVETRLENRDNLRIQAISAKYAVSNFIMVDSRNDQITVRFIIKRSQLKNFKNDLELLNEVGIKGRIVE